jgi:polyhydroxybutyrate depolymerase
MRNIMNKIQILSLTIASCCLLIACGSGSKDEKITQPTPVIETCAGQSLDTGASCISIENREAIVYKPDDAIEGIALFLQVPLAQLKK